MFLITGAVHCPTNINTTADILDPSKTPKECFVYYEWHHPNPDKVLYYKTEIFLNSVISIHKMNIPQEIQNATCLLGTDALSKDDHYLVVITTVDRCNQRASNSKRIGRITSCTSLETYYLYFPLFRYDALLRAPRPVFRLRPSRDIYA